MKKMINRIIVEGLLYDDNLKESETKYINGKLSLLTSKENDPTNVCELRVIAGERYGNKPDAKKNPNYLEYKRIKEQEHEHNYLRVGKEALGIQISGSLGANYFVPRGQDIKRENVVPILVNNSSFISIVDNSLIEPKAEFETDIFITNITPEMTKGTPEMPAVETGNYLVKGYIFDYKNTAIEVTYIAKKGPEGITSAADYFSSLMNSLPVFTKVWGRINGYITNVEKREESAFGQAKVVSFKNTKKEYELVGALIHPYEDGITEEELKQALQAREMEIASNLERQNNFNSNKQPSAPDFLKNLNINNKIFEV